MVYNYHKVLNLIQHFKTTGEMPAPPDGIGNAYIIVEKQSVSSDASELDQEIHGLWLCTTQWEAVEFAHELGYNHQDRKYPNIFYTHAGGTMSEMHLTVNGIEVEQSWREGVLSAGLYAWMFSKTGGEPFLDSYYAKILACEFDNRPQSHYEPF